MATLYNLSILDVEVSTMPETCSVSEARSHLSELLKRLQEDSEMTIEITVNGVPMGELRAPERQRLRVKPGSALQYSRRFNRERTISLCDAVSYRVVRDVWMMCPTWRSMRPSSYSV